MTAWEAVALTCPVLSRPQGSLLRTMDGESPAFIKHQEDAQATAPTTLHYNSIVSGLSLSLDCEKLWVRVSV